MATETTKTRRLPQLPLVLAASVGVAVAVTAVAVWAGGGAAVEIPGIPDAGAVTAWGLPVARTVADTAAVATIGALLLIVVLLPGGKKLSDTQLRYLNWAAAAAALWAAASAAALVFTLSDLFAQPVTEVASAAVLADFVTTDAQGRSYALMTAAAGTIATLCVGISTARWARLALLVALAGLLPPVFTGHSSAAGNHDAAVTSLALHLVGVAVWVGGLVFVLVVAARREDEAADAARRFSPLAAWALLAVAASGIVNAAVRLPAVSDVFTSRYGLMIIGKTVALAALGGIGWWHRQRTLPALKDGRRRAFVRLAAGELLLMAAAMGLAVGLSRTPAPGAGGASLSPTEELLGFPMPPPLGDFPWTPLFTQWHFDPVFAFGTAAAALLYLAGVAKLRARGDKWPVGRTISWLLGLAVTVLATMSGLAVYGKVLFSVHMGQHMILAMTVPILLVLGAPATLALRALPPAPKGEPDGPREMLMKLLHSRYVAVISHPVVASVLFIASAFVVYYSSLFETLMRSHLGHMFMLVHFLAVGLLFFWVVIGIDPGPRRPPHLGRLFALILTMPFHSWFSISLMSSSALIGEGWWSALDRPWVEYAMDDQYNAGAIAWATGDIPVLITTIILSIQWVRSDQREARRVDRKIDRGDANDPLAAYNAYLASLHARDRRPARATPPPRTPESTGETAAPPARPVPTDPGKES
ncbi:bifunctional copper resistance protein CopD/cytochrome c oxidase assembly protein [Streptomyces sp. ActVer]|uniref:bifunctional copper resistance protein CopD/cytochrome c oxidase assembly protein n=1 Tax=Streptomyces sp. ActVer TaxID=3014558 RepID=UPI0022B47411|nr:bifunctional copper resistance protein CopD/cytochrome c oxidase assembly protein [Streptomyces sp. ActVer]MCZ4507414.1 bifunctional copper resistance protein CopD/cytochrome c oxidase assembly protein [Streptomyces sp. ActVer]